MYYNFLGYMASPGGDATLKEVILQQTPTPSEVISIQLFGLSLQIETDYIARAPKRFRIAARRNV